MENTATNVHMKVFEWGQWLCVFSRLQPGVRSLGSIAFTKLLSRVAVPLSALLCEGFCSLHILTNTYFSEFLNNCTG